MSCSPVAATWLGRWSRSSGWAQLLLQAALEAEVTEYLGRERYARQAGNDESREGMRNGNCPTTIKTTAGPVTLQRPNLRGTTERFASQRFADRGGAHQRP